VPGHALRELDAPAIGEVVHTPRGARYALGIQETQRIAFCCGTLGLTGSGGHKPVEQHADAGQMLLDRGSRALALQQFDVSGDVHRLHTPQLANPPPFAPAQKISRGPRVSRAGRRVLSGGDPQAPSVAVADGDGEEFEEAQGGGVPGFRDQGGNAQRRLTGERESGSAIAAFPRMFFPQSVQQRFGPVETCAFQLFHRVIEIKQAAFRREVENAERAGHAKPFSFSRLHAHAIIHEQQVGMKRSGQLNGRSLAGVDFFQRNVVRFVRRRVADLQPGWRVGDPLPYGKRRFAGGQLALHGGGQNDFFKQGRKKIDVSDHDQIVDGAGIGDD